MSLMTASRMKELTSLRQSALSSAFSIADPGKVWVVLKGTLDLFLADVREDHSMGPRSHVLRLQEGRALFGISGSGVNSAGLFANPGADTKVLCLEKAQFEQISGELEDHPLLPMMEQWISDISNAAADHIPSKATIRLDDPSGEVKVDDSPAVVRPIAAMVWVRPVRGSAHFLGAQDLPDLDQNHYFPVARGIWLECDPHTVLECITSEMWLQQDPDWSGLHQFSHLIFSYLRHRRTNQDEKERERLLARVDSDSVVLRNSLLTLAASIGGPDAPRIEQTISSDPLLSACAMVGREAGVEIKQPLGILQGGNQRDPISAIAKASRIRTRLVLLRGRWWTQDNGPLLAFRTGGDRPVALLPRSATSYRLFDPVLQRTENVTEDTAKELKEVAYVFYRPLPGRRLGVWDLFRFGLRGGRRDIATIILMSIAAGALATLTPILTGIIFDDIIPSARRPALTQMTVFLLVIAVCIALFGLAQKFAVLRLEGKMDMSTQAAVWDRMIGLPATFFRGYTAGDLAMRGLAIAQIRQLLTGSALSSILSGIFSVFSFALLFYYSWQLALITTVLTAIAVLVSFAFGYVQVQYQREIFQIRGRISGMMLQFINGIAKFRVSGADARVFAVWAREFTKQKLVYLRARKLSNGVVVFNAVFPVFTSTIIFYSAFRLLSTSAAHHMSTGEFLAFLAAFTQFLAAGLGLSSTAVSMLSLIPLIERAEPILNTLPEADNNKADPGELSGRIEISRISFRYRDDMPLVVNDVSMSIFPGEFVALVGASGSGKSTLFRLLLGFEKPGSGAIYFDSQDLAGLDLHAVRRQLGVVLQNGRIFAGEIYSNIIGAARLTLDDAWEAARLSGLDRDIEQMPMGMNTMVSEGGGGLSGGQRQRLMIARAIVNKPRILLFDEATSALDNQTQAIVSKSLASLNSTRIVIAHRLSTVINAHRIFVMQKGRIVQTGTYSELMSQPGVFTEMAKRQLV